MKQIEVTIVGQSYVLGCPDGGETMLRAAVAQVDREMAAIRDSGKVKARERMAVLAALNLAYQIQQNTPTSGPATVHAVDDATLDALMNRIDHTLGSDGQLL